MKSIVPSIHAVAQIPVDAHGNIKPQPAAAALAARKPPQPAAAPLATPLPRDHDITGWCRFCERTALEVERELLAADPEIDTEELREAVEEGFRAGMPLITGREAAQCFIACVARGLALNLLSNETAGKMIYVAQTALSAHRRS